MPPQPASAAQGFRPAHPMLGTSKGQRGEASPGLAGLGLLLPKLPPEVEKHLENMVMESGFWNPAPRGALGMGSFSGSLVSRSLFGARAQDGPVI